MGLSGASFTPASELANRAGDVSGLEQHLPERGAGHELGRRLGGGLLRPRLGLLVLAAPDVREGDLQLGVDVLRRGLQLALEHLDRLVRLLGEEEIAVGVVDVGGVGVARHQHLEGVLRAGHHAGRLEVAGAAGEQHHLAPRAREVGREHRHAQDREAHRLDDARRVVALEAEVVEDQQRLIELADAGEEDARVVARDLGHRLAADHALDLGLEQIGQRRVVVLEAELAQPLEGPGGPVLGVERDDTAERVAGFGEPLELVERGAGVPVPSAHDGRIASAWR